MAAEKKRARRRKEDSAPCLYLGCFFFDEPGDRERTGRFQIVVEATDPLEAVDKCRDRLRSLRTRTTLFDDPVTIYIEGIIKLTGSFAKGVLVNWEIGDSPPAPHGEITCLIPEQTDHGAKEYGWKPSKRGKKKRAAVEGETIEPFLDFGGMRFRRALEKAKGAGDDIAQHARRRRSLRPYHRRLSVRQSRLLRRQLATRPLRRRSVAKR